MATVSYPVDEWVPLAFGPKKLQKVLITVMSHPDEAPTMRELQYFSSTLENSEVAENVEALVDAGILESVGADDEFVGFTEDGKQFVVDSKLFRGSSVMKAVLQRTEMTDEVEDAFHKRRPDSYMRSIVQPEFDERSWVRESDDWRDAWDSIQNKLTLTVSEDAAQTGLHITVERTVEPTSTETVVVLDSFYEWTQSDYEALGEHERIDTERTQLITVPESNEDRTLSVAMEKYFENSLEPSMTVGIEKESGTRIISAYITIQTMN